MNNKVLLLCPVYYPYPAGGAQSFPLIVKVLSSKFDIKILTEYHPKKKLFEREQNIQIFRILLLRDNFGKKTFLYSCFSYILNYLIIYLFSLFNIFCGIKTFHFTRYIGFPMIPLLYIFKIFGVRNIYDCRTGNNQERLNKAYSRTFKLCKFALANSKSALNNLALNSQTNLPKYLIANPLLLPKPIYKDEILVNGYKLTSKKFISCIGTISKRKSSLLTIKAYLLAIKKFREENNDIYIPDLIFAGRNDLGQSFLNYLSKTQKIIYIGEVTHSESLLLTANSYGSISASSCEGIQRSSLESLYFKIPTILSGAIPEFTEFCKDSCFNIKDKCNEKELSNLIYKLIIKPKFFEISNSKYPISIHSFKNFQQKLLDLYMK